MCSEHRHRLDALKPNWNESSRSHLFSRICSYRMEKLTTLINIISVTIMLAREKYLRYTKRFTSTRLTVHALLHHIKFDIGLFECVVRTTIIKCNGHSPYRGDIIYPVRKIMRGGWYSRVKQKQKQNVERKGLE